MHLKKNNSIVIIKLTKDENYILTLTQQRNQLASFSLKNTNTKCVQFGHKIYVQDKPGIQNKTRCYAFSLSIIPFLKEEIA